MNTLDYLIVIIYSAGFLGLGYIFREQKDGQDYFLGGKSFGWFPLGLSVMATQLSAISFISAPAFVGIRENGGMQWLAYEFGVPLAMIFLMVILFPPLYKSGVVSIYEFLERRFDASSRLLLSVVFMISRAFATGVMVYAISIILESVLNISFWSTLGIIGVITLIYSLQGGMKAVVYGDMIQMIILFIGIIACMYFGISYLGGWDNFIAGLDRERLFAVDFSSMGIRKGEEFGFFPMVIGGFFLYVSYYGTDQSQAQRMLSARSMKVVRQTLLFNGLIRFPLTLVYCFMGLIVGTFALATPEFLAQVPANEPDRLIPVFVSQYLPNGVIGLIIIAILSAAMSSLSSTINSLSAVTMEDFVARGRKLEGPVYMRYSRFTAFFWGTVCILLASVAGNLADTVIEAINKVGSVFFGPILATFLMAIMTRRVNALSANLGLVIGVLVNIYLWLQVDSLFWFWWNAVGAAITFGIGYGTSFFLKDRPAAEASPTTGEGKPAEIDFYINWRGLLNRESIILMVFFVLMVLLSMGLRFII